MQIVEEGNYKVRENWSIEVECTGINGNHWANNQTPCHSLLKVEHDDIVKRYSYTYYDKVAIYGFICPVCHCFTEFSSTIIPDNIRSSCLQVASMQSLDYIHLNDDEKKLSEYL